MVQFGDSLRWTFVMAGLARDFGEEPRGPTSIALLPAHARLVRDWLVAAGRTGAPIDPLLWHEAPLASSYPACMATKAAAEQAGDGGYRYLRGLREGIMCERRKLDHAEVLVEEARSAGLDVERFRIDLRSNAIVEAFAGDLDRTKELAESGLADGGAQGSAGWSQGAGDAPLPALVFSGAGDGEHGVYGLRPYEYYREAAIAAGAQQEEGAPPGVEELLSRFGRVTTKEVETVCELPGPRAGAELFRLAEQWKVRPVWRMTGYMWEAA